MATTMRKGDWCQTFGGRRFYASDPYPEDVHLEDLAHSLALQCRFAGHCRVHYSVAEHSLRVEALVATRTKSPSVRLAALVHDGGEAYVVDVPRPVKRRLGGVYASLERAQLGVIARWVGIDPLLFDDPLVHFADEVLLATERRDLMAASEHPWGLQHDPLPETIVPMACGAAKAPFMRRFSELRIELERSRRMG